MKANITHCICNPAPKVWRVIPMQAQARTACIEAAHTHGYGSKEYEEAYRAMMAQAVATFTTRRDARAYVESIGGTWK